MDFASLDLPEPVLQGIREAGFVTATPIQEAALPLALRGKDVAGQSQTGTGKTAAFLIAAFTRMLRTSAPPVAPGTGAPRMLVIAPTRELTVQIESDARLLGRVKPFRTLGGDRILIFSNTREEARRLEDRLTRNGYETRALTGDVDQKRRLKILNDFKEGRLPVLVATDVASRGLHIEAVSHVINWDLPQDAEDYVHRIGRTARAGAGGKAIGLVDEASALNLEAIEKFIGQKIAVEWADDDLFQAEIKPTAEERRRYSEERRARLAARDRFGDRGGRRGGGRDHGRGGPEHGRGGGERPRHDHPSAAPPPPQSPPPPREGGPSAGRRRRRGGRRRSGGGGPRPEPPPA